MNLLHDHPSEEVRAAAIHLLDALCSWERNTGRKNLVIIKEGEFSYRTICGSPLPEDLSDGEALCAYENLP